jgi:isopentenyl diphosphate isomerase/L-lactate dehydrogenase-like FMN-dependent dehydrogenase
MRDLEHKIHSVEDAQYWARRRMPRGLHDQIEDASGISATLVENQAAFQRIEFAPRAALKFPERKLATTVLGHEISLPVLTSPTANIRIFHEDGERGVARATGAAGTIACISSFTGTPIEEILEVATGPVFFQLYFLGGRENAERMIQRARDCGATAIILTVDHAAFSQRERNVRLRVDAPIMSNFGSLLRFTPQALRRPAWLAGFVGNRMRIETPMSLKPDGRPMNIWEASISIVQDYPTWEDIGWVRETFGGPVIVKGIVLPEDARRAVAAGASAVVVSNHGGNALDGSPATIRALPAVVEAVNGEIEVLLDSGVRRGSDVVKALALGARAVLIGRGYLWGHCAAGSAGVSHMLELFRRQIDATLGLLGCPSVDALDESYVTLPPDFRWEPADRALTAASA